MSRIYNFSAGPAMLPEDVLVRAQKEILNWQNTGVSIMEIGHRTQPFQQMFQHLEVKIRQLVNIPSNYKVLFLPGGAQGHFSFIPMNLTKYNQKTDYFITGIWSERAANYARRYANVNIVTQITEGIIRPKNTWSLNANACYAYYCPNETINGFQFPYIPDTGHVPLIADMTSCILSAPIDVSKFGLIFASAQKNLGIAGITLLIIRDDLLEQAHDFVPDMFNYKQQVEIDSLLNTIPIFPIYMMDLMIDWILEEFETLEKLATQNRKKIKKLYAAIDNSDLFYNNSIARDFRSQVNVPFHLPNDILLNQFLIEATDAGLAYLHGHRLVGGARASIYNAMPMEGVDRLVSFMQDFAHKNRI